MALLKNLDVIFSNDVLEHKALDLICRYARKRNWPPSLPIPLESLIDHVLDLCIEYDKLDEPLDTKIWGCIEPKRRTITLNENHTDSFNKYPGLERFTLGHEVGHWIMHVNESDLCQGSLFDSSQEVIVCRDGDDSVQEQVANRFSAFLLMPKDLMLAEIPHHDVTSCDGFRAFAEKIKVSYTALHLRLNKLGVKHYIKKNFFNIKVALQDNSTSKFA